jgi:hypothetical protein
MLPTPKDYNFAIGKTSAIVHRVDMSNVSQMQMDVTFGNRYSENSNEDVFKTGTILYDQLSTERDEERMFKWESPFTRKEKLTRKTSL